MRCADGRNHELVIVPLICQEAKQQHKQYTKRMLPWFVIPECNIRLDLVLNLLKLVERHPRGGMRLAYEQADAVIGSVCEHTIARHLKWARRLVAEGTLEASELMAELVPFAALPEMRAGGRGVAEHTNRYTPLYVRGSGLSAAGLVKAVLEELKIDAPFFSGRASQLFFVRRGKALCPSGCEPRPATVAPAGSSRSGPRR